MATNTYSPFLIFPRRIGIEISKILRFITHPSSESPQPSMRPWAMYLVAFFKHLNIIYLTKAITSYTSYTNHGHLLEVLNKHNIRLEY